MIHDAHNATNDVQREESIDETRKEEEEIKKKKRNGTEGTIALEIGIPTNRNTKKVLPRYSITGKHHNEYDKHIIVI